MAKKLEMFILDVRIVFGKASRSISTFGFLQTCHELDLFMMHTGQATCGRMRRTRDCLRDCLLVSMGFWGSRNLADKIADCSHEAAFQVYTAMIALKREKRCGCIHDSPSHG